MMRVVYPVDQLFRTDPPVLAGYGRRLLAEGDSWFTIGTLNLMAASNVLFKLEVTKTTAIVNCAYPGDTLQHIANNLKDPYFDKLLRKPNFASFWEAILLSAGGNDLIDAAQVPPTDSNGQLIAVDRRLLLTPAEAGSDTTDPDRFISAPGWDRLARYLKDNFAELVKRRDEGPSANRPMFVHTYAVPTVRAAGTLGAPNGWLFPAFERAGIAPGDRQPTSDRLFERLRLLLLSLDTNSGSADALPHVHVFDSAKLTADIVAALPDDTGSSNDWVNEIHLTPGGYGKLGRDFGAFIEQVLATYPG